MSGTERMTAERLRILRFTSDTAIYGLSRADEVEVFAEIDRARLSESSLLATVEELRKELRRVRDERDEFKLVADEHDCLAFPHANWKQLETLRQCRALDERTIEGQREEIRRMREERDRCNAHWRAACEAADYRGGTSYPLSVQIGRIKKDLDSARLALAASEQRLAETLRHCEWHGEDRGERSPCCLHYAGQKRVRPSAPAAGGEQRNGWIAVGERLPEFGTDVLAWKSGALVAQLHEWERDGVGTGTGYWTDIYGEDIDDVEYWQPILSPPSVEPAKGEP